MVLCVETLFASVGASLPPHSAIDEMFRADTFQNNHGMLSPDVSVNIGLNSYAPVVCMFCLCKRATSKRVGRGWNVQAAYGSMFSRFLEPCLVYQWAPRKTRPHEKIVPSYT